MNRSTLAEYDEPLEVLVYVREDARANLACHFVDTSGNRILLRLNPLAARDLVDELNDMLPH